MDVKNAKELLANDPDPRRFGERKHGSTELVFNLSGGYHMGYDVIGNVIYVVWLVDVGEHDTFYRRYNERSGG